MGGSGGTELDDVEVTLSRVPLLAAPPSLIDTERAKGLLMVVVYEQSIAILSAIVSIRCRTCCERE